MNDRDRAFGVRFVAAGLLLAGGALHTWLAFDLYGTVALHRLFFVNGAVSALAAVAVALSSRVSAAVAGLVVSVGSLGGFALSRMGGGIAGFRAAGLDPVPEAPLTLFTEAAAVALLAVAIFARRSGRAPAAPLSA